MRKARLFYVQNAILLKKFLIKKLRNMEKDVKIVKKNLKIVKIKNLVKKMYNKPIYYLKIGKEENIVVLFFKEIKKNT